MKKLLVFISMIVFLVAPNLTNATPIYLPANFSINSTDSYVSVGDTFSITLNIDIDYTELENLYPTWSGVVYWDEYTGGISFQYDENVVELLSIDGDNPHAIINIEEAYIGGTSPFEADYYVLTFKALHYGFTDLFASGFQEYGDFFYYDGYGGVPVDHGVSTSGTASGTITIPEPSTMLLLIASLVGLVGAIRKRQRRNALLFPV